MAGDFAARCCPRQGDRHEGRGDPVVKTAFDIDQPPDPCRYYRVGYHARAKCGIGGRERRAHQQRQPDAGPVDQGERQQRAQADRQRKRGPKQPQVQARFLPQFVQPDPRRVREQDQGEGELRQLLDQLSAGCDTQECQRPMGKQQPGDDEADRSGNVKPFQPGRQRPPRKHQCCHNGQVRNAHLRTLLVPAATRRRRSLPLSETAFISCSGRCEGSSPHRGDSRPFPLARRSRERRTLPDVTPAGSGLRGPSGPPGLIAICTPSSWSDGWRYEMHVNHFKSQSDDPLDYSPEGSLIWHVCAKGRRARAYGDLTVVELCTQRRTGLPGESDLVRVWSHRVTPRSLLVRRTTRAQVSGTQDDQLVVNYHLSTK